MSRRCLRVSWRIAPTAAVHRGGSRVAEQHQPDRIEHDLQIFQLVDERDAPIFQRSVHDRVARRAGQEHHAITEVGRPGHQRIVEIKPVQLGHDEVADHRGDGRIVGKSVERLAAANRLANTEATPLKDLAQSGAHRALVVHQQNRRHGPILAGNSLVCNDWRYMPKLTLGTTPG